MKRKIPGLPKPYPEPEVIADHLWITLSLALSEAPHNADKIIRDFCDIFGVNPDAVEQRMLEESEAMATPDRVLH